VPVSSAPRRKVRSLRRSKLFETNFFGLVRLTREVLPYLRAQGSGRIINIGSVLGFIPSP
jgi:short-subunit dehydrogenase